MGVRNAEGSFHRKASPPRGLQHPVEPTASCPYPIPASRCMARILHERAPTRRLRTRRSADDKRPGLLPESRGGGGGESATGTPQPGELVTIQAQVTLPAPVAPRAYHRSTPDALRPLPRRLGK